MALAELQADAPPMSAELGRRGRRSRARARRPSELFVEWDPDADRRRVDRPGPPRRVATRRRPDAVAVKVQYPGVDEAIAADLATSSCCSALLRPWLPRPRPEPDGRRAAGAPHRGARLRAGGATTSGCSPTTTPATRSSTCPRVDRRAVARRGCSPPSWPPASPSPRSLDVGQHRARPGRRDDLPLRVPQPLPAAGVQRRPAPGQLPVPRRRAGHVPRLRAGQALHRRRARRSSARWSRRSAIDHDPAAFRRIVEDVGLLRPGAPVTDDEVGDVLRRTSTSSSPRTGR